MERYLYAGQCLDACPEAFYHTKERSCEPCADHCKLCTSSTHCLKCNSSYYVSDGVCAKLECGEGKQGHRVIYELLCYTASRIIFKNIVNDLLATLLFFFLSQGKWRIQITTTAWPVRRAAGSVSCVSHSSVAILKFSQN